MINIYLNNLFKATDTEIVLEDKLSVTTNIFFEKTDISAYGNIDIKDNLYSPEIFDKLYNNIRETFGLKEGITVDLNEKFLFNKKGTYVFFYQSHCNRKECFVCKNIHLRITAGGYVKPCFYNSDYSFPLLNGEFERNMNRAIVNLGNPPCKKLL